MLELGKRYAWDEIIEAYPNKYAFIRDVERGPHQEILSAVLLDVCDFEGIDAIAARLRKDGIRCSCYWTKGPIQEGVFWF